jgi:hypothetical protein
MTVSLLPDDPYDAGLLSRSHPPGWRNPTPAPRYDPLVLGAGVAARAPKCTMA